MVLISSICFVLLFISLFMFFNVNQKTLNKGINDIISPKLSVADKALLAQKKKRRNIAVKFLRNTKEMMDYMHMSGKFVLVCILSVFSAIVAFMIAMFINNPWLIPGFMVIALSVPFIFIQIYSNKYQERLNAELETTMSQISISFIHLLDVTKAIEENISSINPPLRRPFEEFITQMKFTGSNEKQAINELSQKIDNDIFNEWCESLIKCVDNENMMYLLQPSVDKFATLRTISNKIKHKISSLRIEFFAIVGMVYMNIPLFYFLYKEWYDVLIYSMQGRATLGLVTLVIAICLDIMIYFTKPIKFRI